MIGHAELVRAFEIRQDAAPQLEIDCGERSSSAGRRPRTSALLARRTLPLAARECRHPAVQGGAISRSAASADSSGRGVAPAVEHVAAHAQVREKANLLWARSHPPRVGRPVDALVGRERRGRRPRCCRRRAAAGRRSLEGGGLPGAGRAEQRGDAAVQLTRISSTNVPAATANSRAGSPGAHRRPAVPTATGRQRQGRGDREQDRGLAIARPVSVKV